MRRKLLVTVGITDGAASAPSVDAEGLSLWSIEVEGCDESRTLSVSVCKLEDVVEADVPDVLRSDLTGIFNMAGAGAKVGCTKHSDFRKNVFYANRLSIAVKRLAAVIFGSYMGEVSMQVSLCPYQSGVATLSFNTLMRLDFSEPLTFGRNLTFVTMDVASTHTDLAFADDVEVPPTPETALPARVEGSDFSGDVRGPKEGPEFDWEELSPHAPVSYAEDASESDAHLYSSTAPTDKYAALAHIVTEAGEGPVIVVGDHPGSLSRAIAANGVDVTGADPLNRESCVARKGEFGERTLLNRSFYADKDDPLINDSWRAAVIDTAVDGEAAEVTTARNLAIGRKFDDENVPAYCFVRSMPRADGEYGFYMLPGVSRSGCEGLCELNVMWGDTDENKGLWFVLVVEGGEARCHWRSRYPLDPVVTKYFEVDKDNSFLVDSGGWYGLMASRHFVEASVSRRDLLFDYHCAGADNAADLYSRLSLSMDVGSGESRALRATFEHGRVCQIPGLPSGAFRRSAALPATVRARYKRLLTFCADASDDDPGGLRAIMLDCRSGALLRDLSGVRAAVGAEVRLAEFKRVLPYQHMAILASRTFFRAVAHYVEAVRIIIGKPMHPWELQYLLWSLSHFGTREQKSRYIFSKLKDTVYYGGGGRKAEVPSEHSQAIRTFLNKLDDLGVREEYVKQDVALSAGVAANFAVGRKRDPHSAMGPPHKRRPPTESVRSASVVSSTASRVTSLPYRPGAFYG